MSTADPPFELPSFLSSSAASGSPGRFVPTHEWQVVAPDQAIPPGLWVRMDMTTGLKMARLMPGAQNNEAQRKQEARAAEAARELALRKQREQKQRDLEREEEELAAMRARSPVKPDLWLGAPLELACGQTMPNRMIKSALSECMADPATNLPNASLHRLYARWARGKVGGQLTGNVMVDRRYLESPGNVALEARDEAPERLALYKAWAKAMQSHGGKAIMQLSHCGRQCPASVSSTPLAPSAIQLRLPGIPALLSPVGVPRAMTAADIADVIERFACSARIACAEAGFDGVQVHAAHGYLLSSFLSAKFNVRTDAYGGSPANRRRLLLEVVAAVRRAVGPGKIVAVKLNSADFQLGGFTEQESMDVIEALQDPSLGVDFVEVSGGNYENSVMMKSREARARDLAQDSAAATAAAPDVKPVARPPQRESTIRREAFFLSFCEKVRSSCPQAVLMLTGGFRSGIAMSRALQEGSVDLIGLGRPLCVSPDLPRALLASPQLQPKQLRYAVSDAVTLPSYSLALNTPFASMNKTSEAALENFWHQEQMRRMGDGKEPALAENLTTSATIYFLSVKFVRAYLWEPRRKPRQTKALLMAGCAAVAGLVAWAALGSEGIQRIGRQALTQGRTRMTGLGLVQ